MTSFSILCSVLRFMYSMLSKQFINALNWAQNCVFHQRCVLMVVIRRFSLIKPLQKPKTLENTSILYVNLSVVLENTNESILDLLEWYEMTSFFPRAYRFAQKRFGFNMSQKAWFLKFLCKTLQNREFTYFVHRSPWEVYESA